MDVTPLIEKTNKIINNYGENQFNISGKVYSENIIIFPQKVFIWNIKEFNDISAKSFEQFHQYLQEIDILLLGCGLIFCQISSSLKNELRKLLLKPSSTISMFGETSVQTINVETMTTGAACRTYNILLSEGRRVAAALIKV